MKRCAIYTRTTTEDHSQRELAERFIATKGWICLPERYDDRTDRLAFERLLRDIQNGGIDCVVVCDVTRLSRSVSELQGIIDTLEQHGASLVSVSEETDE